MQTNTLSHPVRGGVAQRGKRKVIWAPFLLLAPAIIWYVAFMIYPMLQSLYYSFLEWDGLSPSKTFVGLANYIRIFIGDGIARRALVNNITWTIATLLLPTVMGLLLAVALNSKRLPGKTIFRSIFYAPAILPAVAVGITWAWIYNPSFGLLNSFLKAVGLGQFATGWLSNTTTAFPAVFVTAIWSGIGFPMVLYLAGLQTIPKEQYEAATLDGANGIQLFRHITIPWLREIHVVVITMAIIHSVKVFDLVLIMTYGGPAQSTHVLGTWMYINTFTYYHIGYGSAIAWVIAAIILIIAIPYIRQSAR